VMMATPEDLEDFAIGFSMTEGLVSGLDDVLGLQVIPRDDGIEVSMTIGEESFAAMRGRRRNLVGRTGCGLCGAESLEQALRPVPVVDTRVSMDSTALQDAVAELESHQPLQQSTGAVHAAAWCGLDGRIKSLREDVGRHNALDKLIGHLYQTGFDSSDGFLLISSRASYEMVYKAASAGIEVLVAVSAATTLAVDIANRSGITMIGFARPGRHTIYTFNGRIHEGA
jgi:formate dehydrogenase accessory protein FdhD